MHFSLGCWDRDSAGGRDDGDDGDGEDGIEMTDVWEAVNGRDDGMEEMMEMMRAFC